MADARKNNNHPLRRCPVGRSGRTDLRAGEEVAQASQAVGFRVPGGITTSAQTAWDNAVHMDSSLGVVVMDITAEEEGATVEVAEATVAVATRSATTAGTTTAVAAVVTVVAANAETTTAAKMVATEGEGRVTDRGRDTGEGAGTGVKGVGGGRTGDGSTWEVSMSQQVCTGWGEGRRLPMRCECFQNTDNAMRQ